MMLGDNDDIEAPVYGNCPMPEELKTKMEITDVNVYTLFHSALEGGRQLEVPTEYISIVRNK